MQNKVEDIFDGFIQHKLNEFTPDVTLLHSSYSSFLGERQKKKKRRFFWLFFSLLFIVSLFSYYFLAIQNLHPDKSTNAKSNILIQSDNLPIKKYSTGADTQNITKDDTVNNIAVSNSIRLQPSVSKKNIIVQDGNKGLSNKKSDNTNTSTDKTTNNYTADSILSNIKNRPDSYSFNKDSIQTKKPKPLIDTFYIVW
jgi:cytoskeletal protein RodZ